MEVSGKFNIVLHCYMPRDYENNNMVMRISLRHC